MELFLKQKVFSWGDKFTVYDKNGYDRYYVKGEILTIGKKLHIYDLFNNEVCYIHQKVFSFLPRYFINKNGQDVAEVVKNFTFFKHSYTVNGLNWKAEGDIMAHEYTIMSPKGLVARISKKWFTLGDAYSIVIVDGFNEVDVLSVVLVIDACIEAARRNSSSNSFLQFNNN